MSYTSKEVLEILGEKAQVTAGGIVVHQKVPHSDGEGEVSKHILVGTFPGHSFELTEEGLALLAEAQSKPEKAKSVVKTKKASTPAEPDDDPNFGD